MHEIRFSAKQHYGFYIEPKSDGLYLCRYMPGPKGFTTEDYDWRIFLTPDTYTTKEKLQELLQVIDPENFISIVWYSEKIFPITHEEVSQFQQRLREEMIVSGCDPDTGKQIPSDM